MAGLALKFQTITPSEVDEFVRHKVDRLTVISAALR